MSDAATAELLGRLTGRVNNLEPGEFGEQHSLAVIAAYRNVKAILDAELIALVNAETRPANPEG